MFAASSPGSDQTPSREYIHPMERSPKAVASAGTSAVAPPKFHRDDSVLSEGAALAFCIARSIISRSEEHTSELQSLMRISYAVFCLKTKKKHHRNNER